MHEEQLITVAGNPEEELYGYNTPCAWSHVVDALFKRFLTNEVLQGEYNAVTRATKNEGEDEKKFSTRMFTSKIQRKHVFRKEDAVNYYILYLKPSVREMVAQNLRLMPAADRLNLSAVKKAVVAIRNS